MLIIDNEEDRLRKTIARKEAAEATKRFLETGGKINKLDTCLDDPLTLPALQKNHPITQTS